MFLYDNKYLEQLYLSECQISTKGSQAIMEGLVKNTGLRGLFLSKNRIGAEGLAKLQEGSIGKHGQVRTLDFSRNDIGDEGVDFLIKGLKAQSESQIEHLRLQETNLGERGCHDLASLVKVQKTIVKLEIEGNIVNHRYMQEINAFCLANKALKKRTKIPLYQQELLTLLENAEVTDWNDGLKKIN